MSDYDLCWFCDGTGDDGDWYCRVCKGEGVAERWVMEAESQVVGWSECFRDADDFYDRIERAADYRRGFDTITPNGSASRLGIGLPRTAVSVKPGGAT